MKKWKDNGWKPIFREWEGGGRVGEGGGRSREKGFWCRKQTRAVLIIIPKP